MRPCDLVIHSRILLPQDEARSVLRGHSLAIGAGRILAIAPKSDILAAFAPARQISTGLAMPGLVNAHAHAAMTFARGLGDDLPLMEWLTGRIFPVEARLTRRIVYLGSLLGHAEMLARGVTACMDMYIFEDAVFEAADLAGIRLVGGEAVFAFPSAACPDYRSALDATRRLHEMSGPRLRAALNPHSVYTTDPEILGACRDLAEELALPLHIHLAETASECETCLQKTGLRPVDYCASLGLFDPPATIAHGAHLNDAEIARLAQKNVRVAHNPSSNMKLASGVAPVPALLAAGLAVGLGTDGPASNNQLNLFAEMRQAALLHKIHDPTALPAQAALDMATLHGAACLHWPELGRIAVGGLADVIGLDLDRPNLLPMHNPVSQLVYAATGDECELAVVAGEVLYHRGAYARFALADLLEEMDELVDFARQII